MIVSNLQHSERIEPLHPQFKKAFDYIKSHDLLNTPNAWPPTVRCLRCTATT